jgi:hypothetical protein
MPIGSIKINQTTITCEYIGVEDDPNLNNIGNFYRRKSMHNDILKKLESCSDKDSKIGDRFISDCFSTELTIIKIEKSS